MLAPLTYGKQPMETTKMATELWQRIKTARKYADLRQQDVAVACGISRGAVAQWEYEDAARRTREPAQDHR